LKNFEIFSRRGGGRPRRVLKLLHREGRGKGKQKHESFSDEEIFHRGEENPICHQLTSGGGKGNGGPNKDSKLLARRGGKGGRWEEKDPGERDVLPSQGPCRPDKGVSRGGEGGMIKPSLDGRTKSRLPCFPTQKQKKTL